MNAREDPPEVVISASFETLYGIKIQSASACPMYSTILKCIVAGLELGTRRGAFLPESGERRPKEFLSVVDPVLYTGVGVACVVDVVAQR